MAQIVGVLIALALLVPVVFAFLSLERSYERQYLLAMRGYRERLELIPCVNGSKVYVSIINPGPVDPVVLRYVVLKNVSDGRIVWVKRIDKALHVGGSIGVVLFNTRDIVGKYDVMAVTLDGGVFHLDPEYTGGDGLLDKQDVSRILTSTMNGYYINPSIGWAFNKTLVIRDGSGTVYYFIPYYLGNASWSGSTGPADAGFISFTIPVQYRDDDNDKIVKYIEAVESDNAGYVDVYVVYGDSSKRYLGSVDLDTVRKKFSVLWVYWTGSRVYSYSLFDFTYYVYEAIYTVEVSYYSDSFGKRYVDIRFYGFIDEKFTYVAKYSRTYFYIIPNYPGEKEAEFVIDYPGESRTILGSYGPDSFDIKRGIDGTVDIGVPAIRGFKSAYLCIAGAPEPYGVLISVPYVSYDVYQPSMSASPVSRYYVRPSGNRSTAVIYDDYLLPGSNTLGVSAVVPEVYKLVVGQPGGLAPYMIHIAWLDPRLIVNITGGGDDLLVHYGLIRRDANITFKYRSALLYTSLNRSRCLEICGAGDTVSLSSIDPLDKVVVIIPLEGPFRGNIFYLWIDSWAILKR